MIDIVEFFKSNPMAAAIVGGGTSTAIITYLLKQLVWIPNSIWFFITRMCTTRITISETFSDAGSEKFVIDRLKGISDYLLSLNHRLINNNILTLDTSYNDNRINVGRYYILSQFKKYRVIIKLDIHTLNESNQSMAANNYSTKTKLYEYTVNIIGRAFDRKLYEEAMNAEILKRTNVMEDDNAYYRYMITTPLDNDMPVIKRMLPRPLESIYMKEEVKNNIINHLDNFIKAEHIYKNNNVIYKTGILLYGEPGTGKSSLIRSIVTHTGAVCLNVRSVSPSIINATINDFRRKSLVNAVGQPFDTLNINFATVPIIILIEELDKQIESFSSLGKAYSGSSDHDRSKAVEGRIDTVLQMLDGINSPSNVIFIATTNYMNNIPKAMIRPGRFDLVLEIDRITPDLAEDMIRDMCPFNNMNDYKEFIVDGTVNSSSLFTKLLADKIQYELNNNKSGGNKYE